ncbi:MAG: DNA-binding protein [Betaproteobacteria bacterium]|nr:DNA-binding protein [Betaproteobacteria bacterium]
MTRQELHDLSRLRVREARALLNARHHAGAYYLLGYSVECALKACIARKVRKFDFPDKKTVNDSYVHDLNQLLGVTGLRDSFLREAKASKALDINWTIVKDWSEQARYSTTISEKQARDLYSAYLSRSNGVLRWIRPSW